MTFWDFKIKIFIRLKFFKKNRLDYLDILCICVTLPLMMLLGNKDDLDAVLTQMMQR